jgi:DMSO reductase family type II enzyme iron-sulfur subunit
MATIQKQVRMVFDLNKCLGCHTCTMACKTQWTDRNQGQEYMYWNNVETQPGKGYPKNWETLGGGFSSCSNTVLVNGPVPTIERGYGAAWEYNYADVLKTDGGAPAAPYMTPSPAPDGPDAYASNWDEDVGAGTFPNAYYFYLPRICNHCSNPPCVAACTRKVLYKREEDGIVLLDQSRCRGYRHCVQACPYKKIYWNPLEKVSQKCIFCHPRIEGLDPDTGLDPLTGQPLGNFCVTQCTGRIRWAGYHYPADAPTSARNYEYNVNLLVDKWKVALRLHPEFGTKPNTFYIPPLSPLISGGTTRRIPVKLLAKMFGDTCEQTLAERVTRINQIFKTLERERAKVAAGGTSELVDILTAYSETDRVQFFQR